MTILDSSGYGYYTAKNLIQFQIITPTGLAFNQPVNLVTVTTNQGKIGLLHGRLPFVASLLSGPIRYHSQGKIHTVITTGGLIYGQPDLLKIITSQVKF